MSEITVNDRRLFNKDGEARESGEAADRQAAENRAGAQAGSQFGEQIVGGSAAGSEAAKANRESVGLGSLTPTFSTLVLALATSVMISLGEHVPEAGEAPRVDLPQAKHTIDMLGVLEEKTRGNLDETEDQLLKTLLYDLRIKYVTLIKK